MVVIHEKNLFPSNTWVISKSDLLRLCLKVILVVLCVWKSKQIFLVLVVFLFTMFLYSWYLGHFYVVSILWKLDKTTWTYRTPPSPLMPILNWVWKMFFFHVLFLCQFFIHCGINSAEQIEYITSKTGKLSPTEPGYIPNKVLRQTSPFFIKIFFYIRNV